MIRRSVVRAGALGSAVALLSLTTWVGGAAGSTPAPNDPFWPQQWNLQQIGAPAAWTVSTGKGVRIGIVDTGVDLNHQDLAGKVVASSNCINSGGDPTKCSGNAQDDNGHGTHVAGIAAADTNNGLGVAGTAPDAQLVVAKALGSNGSGNFSDVNAGIMWVVNQGARVVNLSLGDSTPIVPGILGQNSLETGIEYAWSHGAVPVLAAGNTNYFGLGSENYGNTDAIVVGATGTNGQMTSYSSPPGDAKWSIVAPGGDGYDASGQPSCDGDAQSHCVVSTYWASGQSNAYGYDEGTSMATPHVAGTVALLLAMGQSPMQAVNTVLASADKGVSCGRGCAGRLDASSAVGAGSAQAASAGAGQAGKSGHQASPGTTSTSHNSSPGTTGRPGSKALASASASSPGSGSPQSGLDTSRTLGLPASGQGTNAATDAVGVAGVLALLAAAALVAGRARRLFRG